MTVQSIRNPDTAATPAGAAFPFHLHWNADQLAAAMPLRLYQLLDIGAIDDAGQQPSANQASHARRSRPASYLPGNDMPERFRVR